MDWHTPRLVVHNRGIALLSGSYWSRLCILKRSSTAFRVALDMTSWTWLAHFRSCLIRTLRCLWTGTWEMTWFPIELVMPDKSWRTCRPAWSRFFAFPMHFLPEFGPFASCFICSWVQLRLIFFLLALFRNTSTFMQMRLLAGIWKGVTLKQL